jgi:cob(I)alamin adenosyltransferase
MGNRLSKITTRTGDDGTTGLAGNTRVRKDDSRIEVIGEIDELNSHLGLLMTEALPPHASELLTAIQHHLFDLGGELAMSKFHGITEAKLALLDEAIARYNAMLAPLKEFVLPGGSRMGAQCHVCRTVCRRAERRMVSLARQEPTAPLLVAYLNRLADLLFILARVFNAENGASDILWESNR